MDQKVLETRGLVKRYGRQAVVDHVSMSIQRGDIYGLIGQNGAGKTSLIRLITSHSPIDGGEMCLLGESSPAGLQKARARLGCIVEAPAFYPSLTATQNLEYYRLQKGIPSKDCVAQALKVVGLSGTGNKKFKHFSLGMKQRLGLALSILDHPDFIILDEPINGLDPTGIIEVRETLKRLNAQGITIFISSHILPELAQIATRYGFIHKGRLLKEITDAQLKEACRCALHIEVDDAAKACAILEAEMKITDYKVVCEKGLRVYSHLDLSAQIAKRLFESGLLVRSIHEVGDTLEDYYTALIREVH